MTKEIVHPDNIVRRKEVRRQTTMTVRSFALFIERVNKVWVEKGFRSRTHYVCSLIAKDMKWKGPY